MQGKIILISDDKDFFEYIIPKLKLRQSDELFRFSFAELPEKLHLLSTSLLIVNSENNQNQTLELLDISSGIPAIVFGYNDDEQFKIKAYKKGMLAYFTLSMPDNELDAALLPALKLVTSMEKSSMYREMLVKNNIISQNNEVFLDFTNVLEREIDKIKQNALSSTLVAISTDDNARYTVLPNQIETAILNNIRANDILMCYSYNKYFLLLNNANLDKAKKIWQKLTKSLPDGVNAGFAFIGNKNRQQVVSEALNNLHQTIAFDSSKMGSENSLDGSNFKFFRQEFKKKIDNVVSPVFYHIQQKYNDKLFGAQIEQGIGDGYGILYIKTENCVASCRISSPGFSTINIDISYSYSDNESKTDYNLEPKRITLEPERLESGLLQDILEEFILEFKTVISV